MAIAVHTIENLDAKLTLTLGLTRGEISPGSDGNWTEYVKAINGRAVSPGL